MEQQKMTRGNQSKYGKLSENVCNFECSVIETTLTRVGCHFTKVSK